MSEHSRKDYTNRANSIRAALASLKPGDVVRGTCFSQETPDTHLFPDDMKGVTFDRCNLDNVVIPPGNTVTDCTTHRFQVQNDGHDWLIDEGGQPVRILQHKFYEKMGLPEPHVEQIPQAKRSHPEDWVAIKMVEKALADQEPK